VGCRCLRDRASRRGARGNRGASCSEQGGVVRHHSVRVDDVGVGIVTLGSQPGCERVELDHDQRQPALDA
jgi:hypothetical protein